MTKRRRSAHFIFLGSILAAGSLMAAVPAFSQDREATGAPSAQQLPAKIQGSESWTYRDPQANFKKYRTVIIETTTVYSGPDAQFDKVSPEDRVAYAQMMSNALRTEIGKTFPSPTKPRKDTLIVRTSLLGVQKTVGGVATATRVSPMGIGMSALKSLTGKQGTLTGSVLFSLEVYDAETGALVLAGVRRLSPDPLDIPATLSTKDTVKAVARDFAASARKRLEGMTRSSAG